MATTPSPAAAGAAPAASRTQNPPPAYSSSSHRCLAAAPLPSPQTQSAAHRAFASALLPDLPLLMHGSGDVDPRLVDPHTVALLADLTASYVSELVDAAVDAHDIQTDGAGGFLPPPPFKKGGGVSPPPPPGGRRKRGRDDDDDEGDDAWDEPLPEPKVRKSEGSSVASAFPPSATWRQSWQAHAALGAAGVVGGGALGPEDDRPDDDDDEDEPADDWVGAAAVDLYHSSRTRDAYASVPTSIGTQCFIFPICHDPMLYGRVMEVQAARRNIVPELLDNVWLNLVKAEGRMGDPTSKKGGTGGKDGDEEEKDDDGNGVEDEEEEEEEGLPEASWPGLGSLLPTHRASSAP